ncbi:hypothetical protein MJT46_013144 [Ovis ammon polii x Ovis aries]|nr:hypothetical protein MJT46_013144 [Ovis ammon polii x Ovis aries]
MSSALLLALLGITLPLPGVRALNCHWGIAETVRNVSEQPFQWKTSQQNCGEGLGCQETVIITQNEPLLYLLLIKGCTQAANQEARVTEHRAGPGLSITSYTRVCREDLCNDLSTSLPLWTPLPPTGAGEGGSTRLKVQGCISQAGCNLLNGTQEIGPISLRETCSPKGVLTCYRGIILQMSPNLSRDPVKWSTSREQQCNPGEVCQETLLLIDVGGLVSPVGIQGCVAHPSSTLLSRTKSIGVFDVTETLAQKLFCQKGTFTGIQEDPANTFNWTSEKVEACDNGALCQETILLVKTETKGTTGLRCPTCLAVGSCLNAPSLACPNDTDRCYQGKLQIAEDEPLPDVYDLPETPTTTPSYTIAGAQDQQLSEDYCIPPEEKKDTASGAETKEPMLHSKRSHSNEKPEHWNQSIALIRHN